MLIGDVPNPSKCFSLIRKAKSARIRQDLLEKSTREIPLVSMLIDFVCLGAQTSKTKKTSDYAAITGSRRSIDEHGKLIRHFSVEKSFFIDLFSINLFFVQFDS